MPDTQTIRRLKRHLANVMTFFTHSISIVVIYSLKRQMDTIKKMSYTFRYREYFKTAFYLHCGGFDLPPLTHVISG